MVSRNAPTRLALLVGGALSAVGCAKSDRFPQDHALAVQQIELAEEEDAEEHSFALLESARRSVGEAEVEERQAGADYTVATEQLTAAQRRLADAELELAQSKNLLVKNREELTREEDEISGIRMRRGELRDGGLTDGEIQEINTPLEAVARQRLQCGEATIASLEQRVRVAEHEVRDSELDQRAAEARIMTAEERLELSRLLYRRAQEQARRAQAESLDAQRVEVNSRLRQHALPERRPARQLAPARRTTTFERDRELAPHERQPASYDDARGEPTYDRTTTIERQSAPARTDKPARTTIEREQTTVEPAPVSPRTEPAPPPSGDR